MGEDYLLLSTLKNKLFPNAHEILAWLKGKYHLYILTNGFRETQLAKLKNCKLEGYFEKVFTSETIGYNKPNQKIFHWAVSSVNADKEECIMIGDDEKVDIAGAKQYGIDTIFFNPKGFDRTIIPTYEIKDLNELRNIL
jgi:putative hydrolase of the HAD superfamily